MFSLEKAKLWTRILAKIMDLFLTNSFSLLKMLTDGLERCGLLVMLLSAVWTLILTAPIHCRASIEQVM